MKFVRARTVAPLLDWHRNFSPFPAWTRPSFGGLAAVVAVVLLSSLSSPVVPSACAQPSGVAGSMSASAAGPYADFVAEAARRFGIPAHWIAAVMMEESRGEVRAVSRQGAMGLMQIMPDIWGDLRSRHGLGPDPFDPRDNILAGAAYLREMHDRYGSPGFLAAYNAGPERYEEYLTTGRALPVETQLYVAALAPIIGAQQVGGTVAIARRATPWQESALFVARGPLGSTAGSLSALPPSDRPSVGRSLAGVFALRSRAEGLFVKRASAGSSQ